MMEQEAAKLLRVVRWVIIGGVALGLWALFLSFIG
jgi:hypothetical protein